MNKPNRIMLINPPINAAYYKWEMQLGSKLPPLGLLSLAAYTRSKGFDAAILDAYNLGLSPDDTLKAITEFSPTHVGITATTSFINFAAALAKLIREEAPGIAILIGGSHISAVPEETMRKFPWFDIGVLGEGEETIIELLNCKQGQGLENIAGLVYRDGDRVKRTKSRPYIKELDKLPFPAWDIISGFPNLYCPTPTNYKRKPVASLVTSRGCPYNCTFCDRSVFGVNYRSFSHNYVISLITDLKDKFGIREVCFYDDTFTVDKPRLQKICEALQKNRLDITWSCLGRVDLADKETLKLMKKSGCWLISYGVESCSEDILKLHKKRIDLNQVERAIRLTHDAGIRTRGFFMIGNPLETQKSIEAMRKFVFRIPLDEIHISFFTPLPGSEAYDFAAKYGTFDDNWQAMDMYSPNFVPFGWTKKMLVERHADLYKQFYFHPATILRHSKDFLDLRRAANLAQKGFSFLKLLKTDD